MLAPFALGAAAANLAGPRLRSFERVILEAEHVIAAIFATLAGALLLVPDATAGWALVGGITAYRLLLKPGLARLAPHPDGAPSGDEAAAARTASAKISLTLARQSPLALALGVALAASDFSQASRLLLGVVVLAGALSETLLLALARPSRATVAEPPL